MLKYATYLSVLAFIVISAFASHNAQAAEAFSYGHVWRLSFVKARADATETYLQNLDANYKRELDEAKRRGVILSYKILEGDSATKDDWSVIIMLEFPNMAALDGFEEKMDKITADVIGEDADRKGDVERAKIREYLGIKLSHEILLK